MQRAMFTTARVRPSAKALRMLTATSSVLPGSQRGYAHKVCFFVCIQNRIFNCFPGWNLLDITLLMLLLDLGLHAKKITLK